jgi:protein-tyrosine-phosphatase
MAEALLRHALAAEPEPLKSLRVISAGVSAWPGVAITPHSAAVLKKVGLDMDRHTSRELTRDLLMRAALVVVMTESHRRAIRAEFPNSTVPVVLMREFMPPPANPEVPDPYGSDFGTYEDTRDAIMEGVPGIVNHLRGLLGSAS